MEKKLFKLFQITGAGLVILSILVLITFFYSIGHPKNHFSEAGAWYCDELQIQLAFDESSDCFIKDGSSTIVCSSSVDRGSDIICVYIQDENSEKYYLGESVFTGVYVSSNENTLRVREHSSTTEYIFERVD